MPFRDPSSIGMVADHGNPERHPFCPQRQPARQPRPCCRRSDGNWSTDLQEAHPAANAAERDAMQGRPRPVRRSAAPPASLTSAWSREGSTCRHPRGSPLRRQTAHHRGRCPVDAHPLHRSLWPRWTVPTEPTSSSSRPVPTSRGATRISEHEVPAIFISALPLFDRELQHTSRCQFHAAENTTEEGWHYWFGDKGPTSEDDLDVKNFLRAGG
jgi:hypothetical protein